MRPGRWQAFGLYGLPHPPGDPAAPPPVSSRGAPWTTMRAAPEGGPEETGACGDGLRGDRLARFDVGQDPAPGGVGVRVVERVAGPIGRDDELEVGAGALVGHSDRDDVAGLAPEERHRDAVVLAAVELQRDLRDIEHGLHRGLL